MIAAFPLMENESRRRRRMSILGQDQISVYDSQLRTQVAAEFDARNITISLHCFAATVTEVRASFFNNRARCRGLVVGWKLVFVCVARQLLELAGFAAH